jgi:hypothetical protein
LTKILLSGMGGRDDRRVTVSCISLSKSVQLASGFVHFDRVRSKDVTDNVSGFRGVDRNLHAENRENRYTLSIWDLESHQFTIWAAQRIQLKTTVSFHFCGGVADGGSGDLQGSRGNRWKKRSKYRFPPYWLSQRCLWFFWMSGCYRILV